MTVFEGALVLATLVIIAALVFFLRRSPLNRTQENAQELLEQLLGRMQTSDFERTRAQLDQLVNTILPDRLMRLSESNRRETEWSWVSMPEMDMHGHFDRSNIWRHPDVAEAYDHDTAEQAKLQRDVTNLLGFLDELNQQIQQHDGLPQSPETVRTSVEHIFVEFTAT